MVHPFGHPFCYPNLYYLVRLISVWLYQLFENLSHFFRTCVCVCLSLPFSCLIKVDTASMSLIISTYFEYTNRTRCVCVCCYKRIYNGDEN